MFRTFIFCQKQYSLIFMVFLLGSATSVQPGWFSDKKADTTTIALSNSKPQSTPIPITDLSDLSEDDRQQVLAYLLARQAASGAAEGIAQNLPDKEAVQAMVKKMSKELPVLAKIITDDFAQAMQHGTNAMTGIVAQSSNDIAKQITKSTAKNGEINTALQGVSGLATRTVDGFMNGIIYKNMFKMGTMALYPVAGFMVVVYGVPLGFRMLEKAWMTPKLIIASSKKTLWEKLFGKTAEKPATMVFSPTLKSRLDEITQVTTGINQKILSGKTNVKYRNLLLYGPPGTGKTMFATELAKRSGMEYVFMSGSSFSKFKDGEGIEALDELFAWANKSKGLMIFIDEAETFLSKRENMDPQSKSYLLLNNFLNYTGTRSDKFMIVFATNHKDVLDSAMYRRIDDLVEVTLPGFAQRIELINVYVRNILFDEKNNEKDLVRSAMKMFTKDTVEKIAQKTKGLSGSEIEGIVNAIKTSADIATPSIVTMPLIDRVVTQAIEKYFAFTNGTYTGTVID